MAEAIAGGRCGLIAILAVMDLAVLTGTQAAAQQEKVLENFSVYSASPSVLDAA
jgi:hypothetical protein